MTKPLTLAVAGVGTVGVGVVRCLQDHAELMARRCGRSLKLVAVSSRDHNKDRGVDLSGVQWYGDAVEMAKVPGIDVFVELIGGSDGVAKAAVEAALASGKHVVTANKALIAHHGAALAQAAEAKGVTVAYEAAVAGGIPVIKALREGFAGNDVSRVYGILNGTCNYILSQMRETGRAFEDVLAEAQELGYAEADPSFDVDGVDTAHKLAILASLAFGIQVDFDNVYIEGIRHVSPTDIEMADELGYRIKLLGIARRTERGIEQRVHPCMVPLADPIAHVDDVFNAVVLDGDFVGTAMLEGRGAGEKPTASAVIADICDLARGLVLPAFGVPARDLKAAKTSPMDSIESEYYVRLTVTDEPGVFAGIATALKDNQVSMGVVRQQSRAPGSSVPVVMTLHAANEAQVSAAIESIATLTSVVEPPRMIRIESFEAPQ